MEEGTGTTPAVNPKVMKYSVKFGRDKLLTDTAEILKAVDDSTAKGRSYEKHLHLAACSCLNHLAEHGDITLLQRLITTLPKATRRNALIAWAEEFGSASFDEEAKVLRYDREKTSDIDAAIDTPFWEYKAEGEYKPLNFTAELRALLIKTEKRLLASKKLQARLASEPTLDPDSLGAVEKRMLASKEQDTIDLETLRKVEDLIGFNFAAEAKTATKH
jgi:hypothetical protein